MQKPAKDAQHLSPWEAAPSFAPLWSAGGAETLWILATSGFMGALAGLRFAQWQVAVESAQVLAGTVQYPYATSFYTYHIKGWTLFHQVPAAFLAAGMEAETLSLFMTALGGMIAFQALALVASALGANRWLAITAPLFYLSIANSWNLWAAVYPMNFVNTPNTYGSVTLSYVLLGLALLGRGHLRTGWFMLALAPALHPTLGSWGLLVAALGTVLQGEGPLATLKRVWPCLAAALVVLAASFAWQWTIWKDLPDVPGGLSDKYLVATARLGDIHRPVIVRDYPGVLLNFGFVGVAVLWLVPLAKDIPPAGRFLLATLGVSGFLAGMACWLTPWQFELPWLFLRAMPGRYLNLLILALPAVLVGLVGSYWSLFVTRVIWIFPAILLSLGNFAPRYAPIWSLVLLPLVLLAALRALSLSRMALVLEIVVLACFLGYGAARITGFEAVVAIVLIAAGGAILARLPATGKWRTAVACAAVLVSAVPAMRATQLGWKEGRRLMDGDGAIQAARQGTGMIATGSDLFQIQVRTGRPVLLGGGSVDMLPYVPEAGPDFERVLAEVYGIDLWNVDPEQAPMTGNMLKKEAGRELWQNRTTEQWRRIGEEFKVTDVMTYADWELRLPLLAQSSKYRLYHIPQPGE